ncbi:MAG: mechanosensitive ion channel family protein [Myxococcota bacterium]
MLAWGLPSIGLLVWVALLALALPRLVAKVAGPASGSRAWVAALFACLAAIGLWLWAVLVPLGPAARAVVLGELQPWFWGTVGLVAFIGVALALVRRVLGFFAAKAGSTTTMLDDVLIASLRRPAHVLILLAGFVLWIDLVPAPPALTSRVGMVAQASVVVVVVLFLDALTAQIIERRRATSRVVATAGTVFRAMARVLLFVLGLLMVLGTIGIEITPVIASLGVGSLAIGLALQSTLEDFIAGLLIAADQPVTVGDFVDLGHDGLAGTVDSIGWRTTRLLTRERTKVIVPNATLARATLVNRSRPSPIVRFQASVGVHYDSQLGQVARVVQEVAAALQAEHDKATRDFQPVVTFVGFGESSVDLVVWLEAIDWEGHFLLHDAFIRALHERFRVEGIVIPYPIRTLELAPRPGATAAPS